MALKNGKADTASFQLTKNSPNIFLTPATIVLSEVLSNKSAFAFFETKRKHLILHLKYMLNTRV